jgi:nucleoside-diphosphate-sugar epimerase
MNVVVTGGASFLGSHLCERLSDDGCHVHALDNFLSGTRATPKVSFQDGLEWTVRRFTKHPEFLTVSADESLGRRKATAYSEIARQIKHWVMAESEN